MSANKENVSNHSIQIDNENDSNNAIQMHNESDSDFEFDERAGTPVDLIEAAAEASEDLLPSKSKERYQKVYDDYIKWKQTKKATSDSERVVVAYFNEMIKSNKKPTTIWAQYSMLKATLKIFDKVNIETYQILSAVLKKKSRGYVPKKAITFSEEEIQTFLDNAPDVAWLDVKVTSLLQKKKFFSKSFVNCRLLWHLVFPDVVGHMNCPLFE